MLKMTKQGAFDKVLAHLRAQGKAAADDYDQCKYRMPDGRKCAVGCLIPDADYNPGMEGKTVQNLQLFPGKITALLDKLQILHDSVLQRSGMVDWEVGMSEIARNYNLKYTPPKESGDA